ncbi:unnamed protein product [Prorocentrum cordatum]|uniref:Subtilisin n=1 Tax=Prorocentrum cordatum TaxID=2364126 RepID=A0ABN9XWL5_9DINO|nr:unnamed protein product [Polarella glacialis]
MEADGDVVNQHQLRAESLHAFQEASPRPAGAPRRRRPGRPPALRQRSRAARSSAGARRHRDTSIGCAVVIDSHVAGGSAGPILLGQPGRQQLHQEGEAAIQPLHGGNLAASASLVWQSPPSRGPRRSLCPRLRATPSSLEVAAAAAPPAPPRRGGTAQAPPRSWREVLRVRAR